MGVKRKLTKAVQREVYIEEVFQDYLAEKKALNKSPATITSAAGSFKRWYEYLESKAFSLLMKWLILLFRDRLRFVIWMKNFVIFLQG